ncbi:hypothetical protein [Catalinimonas niigatensis]|uniref:hypothetical protein n=1 Tax=Catalinimonas niigatensis TaxID=1397264 RepID=UPI0026663593|nr:hypothetical protein [Catalinimonas niigatensis]WPP50839.1 hypothetical protein PZB72_00325 [Catalinimonas niigatensis]
MKYTHILFPWLLLIYLVMMTGCDEHGDPQAEINLNDQQKAAVSMRGTWGQPSQVTLPEGTTEGVLDSLLLEFRISDAYAPSTFNAAGAGYFFSADNGLWNWVGESNTNIALSNVTPITQIEVIKEASTIRITFTYEGTEGARTSGLGAYGVTLKKTGP